MQKLGPDVSVVKSNIPFFSLNDIVQHMFKSQSADVFCELFMDQCEPMLCVYDNGLRQRAV